MPRNDQWEYQLNAVRTRRDELAKQKQHAQIRGDAELVTSIEDADDWFCQEETRLRELLDQR